MQNLNRRIFLRGLGGAVVAAPFLSSLYARSAGATAEPGRAKRTIVMFTHYGCITNDWFPAKLDGELTAADLLPTSLAPLAPFAEKLLLPRGMRGMNEWSVNNTGPGRGLGQGNDMHLQSVASALTCQPVSPNSNDPFSFDTTTRFDAKAVGPSLDHVIAQQLSRSGAPLLLNTAGQLQESAGTALSYSGPETIFRATSASEAFANLTGLFGGGTGNADSWELAKGRLMADIVESDLSALRARDMSRADQLKLDAWLELANMVTELVISPQCSQDTARLLGARGELGTGDGDALTRKVSDTMDNADLYSAIAVLTAACEANPVIVLKYPGSFTFSGLGIQSDSDLLAHRLDNAGQVGTCAPSVIQNVLKIDAYQAQKFANLVKMLDGVHDDDGTLLDSSVVVWTTDCSDGCARNLNNLPIIQAGSGGGYFKTGKIINLDAAAGGTAEAMLGRSNTICIDGTTDMVDGTTKSTGTDPQLANRPVNKYFCNIMNAMGLRAGADGYAAKDGPEAEVTHFGYADRTQDFCGGAGALPDAGIHDPGGFDELKA